MDDLCPTQPTADWHYFTREVAIDAWNRRAECTAKVTEGTCQGEIDTDYFDCRLVTFKCKACGWDGIVFDGDADALRRELVLRGLLA